MQKRPKNAPRIAKNVTFDALKQQFGGLQVHVFDEIDSTNTEAKRMVADGFVGDALLVAHRQTAGRGRMGRSFFSPAQTGAYFSILHTLDTPLCDAVAITCAASVAVMRAIRTITGVQTEIKWVNDLYYNDKKVCGILTEAVSSGQSTHVIVGIGINLNTTHFPTDICDIAGSLQTTADASQLIAEVYRQIAPYMQEVDTREWLDDYRTHSCVLGRQVAWIASGNTCTGTAEAIDETGALLVRNEQGEQVRLHTGEISLKPILDSKI